MPSRICTFDVCLPRHRDRFADKLFGTLNGHSAILGVTHSVLKVADYATVSNGLTHDKVHEAAQMLGNVKVVLALAKIPKDLNSIHKRGLRTQASCQHLYRQWKQGEAIKKEAVLETAISVSGVVYKVLSCLGHLLVKPARVIDYYVDLGPKTRGILNAWSYFSFVKTGAKITYFGCKIANGGSLKVSRVASIALEIGDIVLMGLQMGQVRVHPAVTLTCAVSKSLLEVYQIWEKTA